MILPIRVINSAPNASLSPPRCSPSDIRHSRSRPLEKNFTEDEVVIVRHPEQMVEACKYYLEHDEEREAMGKRAMDKVLDIHTYKRRTRELLNLL